MIADRVDCIGLSGGDNRAALRATHDRIAAAAIIDLMNTYAGLLDHNLSHTWMLFPFGWMRYGDWPDLAARRCWYNMIWKIAYSPKPEYGRPMRGWRRITPAWVDSLTVKDGIVTFRLLYWSSAEHHTQRAEAV